jgi:hypothetical protein
MKETSAAIDAVNEANKRADESQKEWNKSQREMLALKPAADAAAKVEREAKAHEKLVDKINEEAKALERKARVLETSEANVRYQELKAAATDAPGRAALNAYTTAEKHEADAEAARKAKNANDALAKSYEHVMEGMREERILLEQGTEAKERARLATQGFTKTQIDAAMAQWKAIEADKEAIKKAKELEAAKKSEEKAQDSRAAAIAESVETPEEKYKEQIKEIAALEKLHHENKMRGIDEETAARARQKAAEDYMGKAMKSQDHAGQMESLQSAYNRISSAAGGGQNPQHEIAANTKETAHLLRTIAGHHTPHSEHRKEKSRMGA